MDLSSNDFELFGLPQQHALDAAVLEARRLALQSEVHPDRHASQGVAAQRVAMQWAVRVNEAYRRLKDPVTRGAYLCELHGVPIDAERSTAMPAAFLMRQMEWREALDDAATADDAARLGDEVAASQRQALAELTRTLDERHDYAAAAQQVRALMFSERFAADVDKRLEALGQ